MTGRKIYVEVNDAYVQCTVMLVCDDAAIESDVIRALSRATVTAANRFAHGPYEDEELR